MRRIANCGTQLRSLSLSRYDLEDVSCVSAASQLTNLSLQHCSLTDDSLQVWPGMDSSPLPISTFTFCLALY